ncbi:HD-GYP domain-containing protein [Gracilibacillus phocaeensis]|uniref:HD-GYP domain-containing protein n=1 Tax=Gracilibacillus phocaeensis TaxID=2042304 RepID=UPI0013EF5399|nr:HD-GYP domain-containing protein [Gracilibacillus phocaeensis]
MHPGQLQDGCVITKDVVGLSKHPIMKRNTIVSEKHIQALQHFNIAVVEVSESLASGKPFVPSKKVKPARQEPQLPTKPVFHTVYEGTVAAYKKMFQGWQGGIGIDLPQVRQLLSPLLAYVRQGDFSILSLSNQATAKDYFFHHGVSVSLLAADLAKRLGYKQEWFQVGMAAFLMDSGMAKLHNNFLEKSAALTEAEWNEIKQHPVWSYRMVEHVSLMASEMKLAVLQHHERMDGSGYPLGVEGAMVHPFAQILAVSDVYHAMTTGRVYQKPQTPFQVVEEIQKQKHHQLDFATVEAFMDVWERQIAGAQVLLSNGEAATIVYLDRQNPSRPIVRLLHNDQIVQLTKDQHLAVEEIL